MEDREKPSLGVRIFGPLIFIFGSFTALGWFIYRVLHLLKTLNSKVILFDKGSFYMLGVGAGLLVLAVVTVQEGWFNKPLSERQSIILTRIAILSLALLILVPHFTHYLVDEILVNNGYAVCQEASHQWLFVRDIVYTQDSIECSADLKNRQI